jgi:hypothetical protein
LRVYGFVFLSCDFFCTRYPGNLKVKECGKLRKAYVLIALSGLSVLCQVARA